MECERCGGPCWDNRTNKKNPRGPDFSCKDKQNCGWKKWLTPKPGPGAPVGNGNTNPSFNRSGAAGGYTWNALALTFQRCWTIAGKVVGEKSPDRQAATATVFIAATKLGLSAEKAIPAPPPPPPPPPLVEDFDPSLMGESDDDDY